MTTEYTRNRSPRLPENHPQHVEQILARSARRRPPTAATIIILTALAWIAVIALILHAHLK